MLNQWEFLYIECELNNTRSKETRMPLWWLRGGIIGLLIFLLFFALQMFKKHELISLLSFILNIIQLLSRVIPWLQSLLEMIILWAGITNFWKSSQVSIVMVHPPVCSSHPFWSLMPFCSQKPSTLVMRINWTCW